MLFRCWPAARLFLNHMDAWAAAFMIAAVALLVHDSLNWRTAVLLTAITFGYWFAFALNDYHDAPFDAADPAKGKRNFFVGRSLSLFPIRFAAFAVTTFLLLAFLQFRWQGIVSLSIGILVMWAYSAPPLRLKSRPGLDLLIHALFVETFPYLITLLIIQAIWRPLDFIILGVLFFASLTAQLEQQVRDFDLDARAGGTFATWAGRRRTLRLLQVMTAGLLTFTLIAILGGQVPAYLLPYGLFGLPAMIHRFVRGPAAGRSETLIMGGIAAALVYTLLLLFLSR